MELTPEVCGSLDPSVAVCVSEVASVVFSGPDSIDPVFDADTVVVTVRVDVTYMIDSTILVVTALSEVASST